MTDPKIQSENDTTGIEKYPSLRQQRKSMKNSTLNRHGETDTKDDEGTTRERTKEGYRSRSSNEEDEMMMHHPNDSGDRVMVILMTILAVVTRFFRISHPAEVVFDEKHFGEFASYYVKRKFFFDVHPPLGKMLFAGIAYIFGFSGEFMFDHIGKPYRFEPFCSNPIMNATEMVLGSQKCLTWTTPPPYIAMRSLSAVMGALIIPLLYLIMRDRKHSRPSALFTACLALLGKSLLST
jgi:dolichyl-phosphate-mannose-protein mannosyltransferase